ncbi:hypothetical protein FB45DRAFT_1007579 [Roridomyces roridus]|uniref:Uncharacterized protein n=1 Tax=Roridomyces roridus TaxID=1738132 RepID=A0AAD7BDK5_9AGAR|nr:hypothetical protein FB45DRAFT_1007579 [Roridomyces roridus]
MRRAKGVLSYTGCRLLRGSADECNIAFCMHNDMATTDTAAQSTNSSTILGGELTSTPPLIVDTPPGCATPPVPGAYPEEGATSKDNQTDVGGEGLVDVAKAAVAGITGYFVGSSPLAAHHSGQNSPPSPTTERKIAVDTDSPERQSTMSSFTSSVSDISSIEDRRHDGYAPLGSTPALLSPASEIASTPPTVYLSVGSNATQAAPPPFTPIPPVNGLDAAYFPSTVPLRLNPKHTTPFTPIPPVKSEADGVQASGYFAPPTMQAGDQHALTAVPLTHTHHFFSDPEHPLSLSDHSVSSSNANASVEAIATASVAASSDSSFSVFTASAQQQDGNAVESVLAPEAAWEKFEEHGFAGAGMHHESDSKESVPGDSSFELSGDGSRQETLGVEEEGNGHEREIRGNDELVAMGEGKKPRHEGLIRGWVGRKAPKGVRSEAARNIDARGLYEDHPRGVGRTVRKHWTRRKTKGVDRYQ